MRFCVEEIPLSDGVEAIKKKGAKP
jgi:hypothetical protein